MFAVEIDSIGDVLIDAYAVIWHHGHASFMNREGPVAQVPASDLVGVYLVADDGSGKLIIDDGVRDLLEETGGAAWREEMR